MKLIAGYDSFWMPDEVFISYARSDREKVMPVVDILPGTGISVWVDEAKTDAATLWSEEIVDAINNCKAMVVMLSQSSTGSDSIVNEVMLASENKKKMLPVHLESTEILRKHGGKTGAELKAEGK
jgi:hypothetical protein